VARSYRNGLGHSAECCCRRTRHRKHLTSNGKSTIGSINQWSICQLMPLRFRAGLQLVGDDGNDWIQCPSLCRISYLAIVLLQLIGRVNDSIWQAQTFITCSGNEPIACFAAWSLDHAADLVILRSSACLLHNMLLRHSVGRVQNAHTDLTVHILDVVPSSAVDWNKLPFRA